MATIAESNEKMTVFYSKSSGKITGVCKGIQDMSFFGDFENDFSIIYDYVVLPYNLDTIKNAKNYQINIETHELENILPIVIALKQENELLKAQIAELEA